MSNISAMDDAVPLVPNQLGGPGILLRSLLQEVVRSWRIIAVAILLSIVVAIVVVRSSPPMFAATTALIKARADSSPSLSILSQMTGGGSSSGGSIDELRATLQSRVFAQTLASNATLRPILERELAVGDPTLIDRLRSFVRVTLFGQRPSPVGALDERLQNFLVARLALRIEDSIIHVDLVHSNPEVATLLLSAAVQEAQRTVLIRQRARAVAYRQYLSQTLDGTAAVVVSQVSERLLTSAIEDVMRLSGPGAQIFVTIDEAYADGRPVSPKVGLTLAVCLALGLSSVLAIIILRRVWKDGHAAVQG